MAAATGTGTPRGVTVVNQARIHRQAAAVFDYLTDLHRELDWNDKLEAVEPLNPGELQAGSRFRVRFAGPVGDSVITYEEVDRPYRWRTRSEGRRLQVWLVGTIVEVDGVSEVTLQTTLQPLGMLRLLGPMVAGAMRTAWDQHLATIKHSLEDEVAR